MEVERIKRAKNGDVDEIGQLIVDNMQSLYRVAFSILRNDEEIYDAISNTTVIVFEKIKTLKKEEFFKTWLTRILMNECYKIYNQNKKIVHLETYKQEELSYDDTYVDLEMKTFIKSLDKDLQKIIILYYFEEFSVKEIAELVKVPEGTVKSRLSRARNELSKLFKLDEDKERGNGNAR